MIKILAVAHDAGGANILASLIKKYHNMINWVAYPAGPARNIFLQKKIKSCVTATDLTDENIEGILKKQQPDFLLTGTSWGSDLEVRFIKEARKGKRKSASFLDQWGGYRERFGYPASWKLNLPDVLFVGDRWAYELALKNGFPKKKVKMVENPYFEEIIRGKEKLERKKAKNGDKLHPGAHGRDEKRIQLLYVSQPIYAHALKAHNDPYYWGFTEYDIVDDLLKIVELLENSIKVELKIRLHPSERADKYSLLLAGGNYRKRRKLISVSSPDSKSLMEDCLWADGIVGSGSMALFIALLTGKKSISYIPAQKRKTYLSQKEIQKLYALPQKEIKMVFSVDSLIGELSRRKNERVFPSEEIQRALAKNSFLTVIDTIV